MCRLVSECAHCFEFSGGYCLHGLSQATGERYLGFVGVGHLSLRSQVLLLPHAPTPRGRWQCSPRNLSKTVKFREGEGVTWGWKSGRQATFGG